MLQNNLGNPYLRLAIRAALTGGTLAGSVGLANAQVAPPPATADNSLAEVVVTGSRISVPNQVSISPVTFLSTAEIQETGATRIEDVLNQLPQVFASMGANIGNGADGTASVNLRGLNAKRTLVLVDGQRLGPGDATSGAQSDINIIPTELVESVEVLTGGASSVYGADAVAGVVNFKMNDHFEGVKLVADAGFYNHKNDNTDGVEDAIAASGFQQAPSSVNTGATKSLTFIAGLNSADGNGNATVYATYRNVAGVLGGKYSYGACALGSGHLAGASSTGGKFYCGGSGTSYPGLFIAPFGANPSAEYTVGPNGSMIPFTAANEYNYGNSNPYLRPDEQYTAGSFLHYEFNEHATVYSQFMFMDDRTVSIAAPSGAFDGSAFTFNCANPYLSASEVTALCNGSAAGMSNGVIIGRRNVEGGDREDDLEHMDFHEVMGVKGKINSVWDYDTSFQYSLVDRSETFSNDVSTTKIDDALNVVNGPNGPECAVTAAGDTAGLAAGCVPWNIFKLGGVTQAAANYIGAVGLTRGRITQTIANVNFTGDLGQYGIQLPSASTGLKVNFGGEYRDVKSFTEPDEEFQTFDLAGQGGPIPPISGGQVAREGFVEMRMPLAEDKPFAKQLNVETGFRYSEYSQGFDTNTYKFGIDWAPVQDVRLRASFARAVRAPNVVELYSPQSISLDGTIDPCAGANPTATLTQCARTGVTAAQYGHILQSTAGQYNGLTGGNPDLLPETALTTSVGIGFTPTFIPNFRAQIDYYDIKIENVIQSVGANTILTECYSANLFCGQVHRDPNIGTLFTAGTYVADPLENVGKLEEKGVDVDVAYALDVGPMGKVRTNLTGTWLNTYEIEPIAALGSTSYNCAGYYGPACSSFTSGAGTPVFRWRHVLRTTWATPWQGLDVTLSWRYYSPVLVEGLSGNPNLSSAPGTVANGGISNTDARIASYSYFDLTGSIRLTDKVSLRLGVNNILDKDPPLIGTSNLPAISGNNNTFPQVYDSLGRYIFGQITAQF
jgi:iron complex outermembrane recepter protein